MLQKPRGLQVLSDHGCRSLANELWTWKMGKSLQGLKVRKQHLFIAHLVWERVFLCKGDLSMALLCRSVTGIEIPRALQMVSGKPSSEPQVFLTVTPNDW